MSVLASLAGFAAFDGSAEAASAQAPALPASKWDLSWFDDFKGKHKQVYDYGTFDLSADSRPLRFVRNYHDAHKELSGLEPPEINTVVGCSHAAFPINASDALWEKYKLGERWKIIDPATKQPSVRNLYMTGVKGLQASGTTFWQCNVALSVIVLELSQGTPSAPTAVRAELIAGLHPGVRLVPAHVMAVGLAQERGFTYVKP
jgi:intracellular sulfur oxidation DsrE/DsrF family protein